MPHPYASAPKRASAPTPSPPRCRTHGSPAVCSEDSARAAAVCALAIATVAVGLVVGVERKAHDQTVAAAELHAEAPTLAGTDLPPMFAGAPDGAGRFSDGPPRSGSPPGPPRD